jgi:glycosyltransferase involved in cell wall biosynthesis
MRLLLVVAEMAVGGAERLVVQLAAAAQARGDEVVVAAAPGPLDAELETAGVERVLLREQGRSPLAVARAAASLARPLRRFEPELVHVHNVRVTAVTALAARLAFPFRGLPIVTTFHGVLPKEYRAASSVLKAAEHVVCVSDDVAGGLRAAGLPATRISVIENGVPLKPPLPPERRERLDRELQLDGQPVVSIVGRLVPQKAHHRFLEAAAIVAEHSPATRFLVVGDGPLRSELELAARRLSLEQVRFTGVRRDAGEIIARSALLVFSSDWEGLSLAALESLAAGVPVVSSDVQGMRELLSSGAGVLVPGGDPHGLAEAMVALLEDGERRRTMGEVGRALVRERYSIEQTLAAYEGLYWRLLERGSPEGVGSDASASGAE